MGNELKLQRFAQYFVLFLLATIPVVFGAVHPIMTGTYTALIFFVLGSWLLLNPKCDTGLTFFSAGNNVLFLFIFFIVLSLIPLPLQWLAILSPARSSFIESANQLAGTNIQYAPLGYNSTSGILTGSFVLALLLYAATLKILLIADPAFLRKILFTCLIVGIIEAIYGLLQATNPHLGVLWLSDIKQFQGMARGTIIYKNQYAALMNMIWPLTVGLALLYFKNTSPQKNKKKKRSLSRKRHRSHRKGFDSLANRP
ncbi:MAG: hypothetical protein D3916_04065, partial [Candidatus Electrothrix sp. MAN1_4]|nr:hypothetical protein [Candidatus Electrothrix sp. MAN1_4]